MFVHRQIGSAAATHRAAFAAGQEKREPPSSGGPRQTLSTFHLVSSPEIGTQPLRLVLAAAG